MSIREETPGQPWDTLERLFYSAGFGQTDRRHAFKGRVLWKYISIVVLWCFFKHCQKLSHIPQINGIKSFKFISLQSNKDADHKARKIKYAITKEDFIYF